MGSHSSIAVELLNFVVETGGNGATTSDYRAEMGKRLGRCLGVDEGKEICAVDRWWVEENWRGRAISAAPDDAFSWSVGVFDR